MTKQIIRLTESDIHRMVKNATYRIIKEMAESGVDKNGNNYFAVNKRTGLIVYGWDYRDEDPSDLKSFKNDYFFIDLKDNDLNPKDYKIVTGKYLQRNGVDINDEMNCWSNNGEIPYAEERRQLNKL
jgi:hypothetical protein